MITDNQIINNNIVSPSSQLSQNNFENQKSNAAVNNE
jgi:hypothetical protein